MQTKQDRDIIEALDKAVKAYNAEPEFLPGEREAFLSAVANARNLVSLRAMHRDVMAANPPPAESFPAEPEELPLDKPDAADSE